jgi:hypothetical protein
MVLMIGSLYFRLHALPERIAHGTSQLQFQLVAVLALLALFTHNNLFWVAALLLALVPIPDFWTPLANMSESLSIMASRKLRSASPDVPSAQPPEGIAASSLASAEAALHHPRPVEVAVRVPTKEGNETPPPAPPIGMDGSPSVSDTQGLPESPSGSRHRVLPREGRES